MKNLKYTEKSGNSNIRLLSSITPLGIKTQYDTIFENYSNIININDTVGLLGTLVLSIIKDYALKKGISVIFSPTYYEKLAPQFLIFKDIDLAITISDNNHILPFEPTENINAQRFYYDDTNNICINKMIKKENALIYKSVLDLYSGRDFRFKLNYDIYNYSDLSYSKKKAEDLVNKIAK